jgi:hypothetical protein
VQVSLQSLALREAFNTPDTFTAFGHGGLRGLTVSEISQCVGRDPDPETPVPHASGYLLTWSQPGYSISVLFGHDERAMGVPQGREHVG